MRARIAELRARVDAGQGSHPVQASSTAHSEAESAEPSNSTEQEQQSNGVSTSHSEEGGADESDAQPAAVGTASKSESNGTVQESLEDLEAELTRVIISNDDKAKYARGNSGRW